MVGMEGFEPTHPKELIYSQPPLSNSAASPYIITLSAMLFDFVRGIKKSVY